MWYFIWVLGLGFALLFTILNAAWHDKNATAQKE